MTKKLCASLLLLGCAHNAHADDTISHTFFSARPQFQSGSPLRESFFRDDRIDAVDNGFGGTLEMVFYGSNSTKSHELAEYFGPFGKRNLTVSEYKADVASSTTDTNTSADLQARHFNIQTSSTTETFQSTIKFSPEQQVFGLGLAWKQTIWNCDDKPKMWLEVAFPIEQVKTKMGLKETITNDGGGAVDATGLDDSARVGSMTAAFKQSNWKYGKVNNSKCLKEWGVADVEVKLNWASLWSDCCNLSSYIGFVAPTGTQIDAKNAAYIFSPVVGNNRHWGFLFGGNIDYKIWSSDNQGLYFAYSMAGRILAGNNQVRSFDLKDKQWGRYMEVYRTAEAAELANTSVDLNSGTSGINVFTKCLEVKPRYCADGNSAIIYRHDCGFNAEIGYNLYVRQAEEVCLKNWNEAPVLKSVIGAGEMQLARTIGKQFTGSDIAYSSTNYSNTTILKKDLNIDSASHPSALANIVYGGLGYDWSCVFIGLGASYEFSSVNTIINRWAAWGKLGFSY